tara:strand:+ start:306 stop:488 length:183 start_codon:yes stop_codon:yes gene_type:complete
MLGKRLAASIIPHRGDDKRDLVHMRGIIEAEYHGPDVGRFALYLKNVHARVAVLEAAMIV